MNQEEYNQKAKQATESVKEKVTDLKDRLDPDQVKALALNNALQLITTVAVVGILINNRRSLKFTKRVVKNMDKNTKGAQDAIKALKAAGEKFTFYPGVGVWVD